MADPFKYQLLSEFLSGLRNHSKLRSFASIQSKDVLGYFFKGFLHVLDARHKVRKVSTFVTQGKSPTVP